MADVLQASTEYSVIGKTLDGTIDLWNQGARKAYGYERDEVIGRNAALLHVADDVASGMPALILAAALQTGKWEGVIERQRKNGERFTARIVVTPRLDPAGTPIGVLLISKDISSEIALNELKATLVYSRSLIEASADALFVIAPDGIIKDVNEEATRLTGHVRTDLVGLRFADQFTDPARAQAGTERTLAEKRVLDYELTLVTRTGRQIPLSFNAGVFTDAANLPLGILAAARDITHQKVVDQQLRDVQFYTRSLIEANIFALMTTDPIGVITDVNKQMEALTGYQRDELIGSPFKQFFTDPLRAEDGVNEVLRGGNLMNYELTAIARDGHETLVSYNATRFYDRNKTLQGVFAAARDVTERTHFVKALQEKNIELENANLAKDRFLASMSHELRTPLNAIIGFTGVLLMRLAGPLTEDQEGQLKTVRTSGRHLLSLINDLLDVAKVESGNVELVFEDVVCQDVVHEVAETLAGFAQSKGLAFEVSLPDGPVTVRTDRRALSQILINFVNNAIKFTEVGSVTIRLTPPALGDGGARLSVIDTGPGLPPENAALLFQAFRQLDSGSTRRHEGTGLGLYLSKKLADLLGCSIALESQVGMGCIFSLGFAAAQSVAPAA